MKNNELNLHFKLLLVLSISGGILVLLLIIWFIMWILQYRYKKNNPNWEEETAQLEKEDKNE